MRSIKGFKFIDLFNGKKNVFGCKRWSHDKGWDVEDVLHNFQGRKELLAE